MIEPVAPAKAMQLPAPLLEERHHRLQRGKRLDAVAGVIAPPRMRPARIARLAARAERHDLGAPLRPARALQRDVKRKQDFMEGHGLASRAPDAVQRAALAERCPAEPGPRFLRAATKLGPGSAAHHAAEEAARCAASGAPSHKLRCPRATARAIWPVM